MSAAALTACGLLFATTIFLPRCQKEQFAKSINKGLQNEGEVNERTSFPGVSLGDNILIFDDFQTFTNVYEDLDNLSDGAEDPYVETDDDIFVDDDPILEEFENNLGFQSLRKIFLLQEHQMLITGFDPEMIPDPFTDDDVLLACLNSNSMVQIDNLLYWFKAEDEIYIIPLEYASIIDELIKSDNILSYSGVTLFDTGARGTTGTCDASFVANGFGNALSGQFVFNGSPLPATGVQFKWIFGDGTQSTQQNPTHVYASAGTYRVYLTIVTPDTCTATKYIDIKAGAPCSAYFRHDKTGEECRIVFTDKSTTNAGNITSWEWSFPGGTPSTYNGQFPGTVLYNCNGEKVVTLKIKNSQGCTDIYTEKIEVTSCECCKKKQKIRRNTEFNGGANKIKWVQKQNQNIFSPRVAGKMKHYKRKNNGGWKKVKADLEIKLSEFVYSDDTAGCSCKNEVSVNDSKSKKSRKIKLKHLIGQKFDGKLEKPWKAEFIVDGSVIFTGELPTLCEK
jgi:PKD repeat protein